MIIYKLCDAGREEAGYNYETKDCAVRSLALATGSDYGRAHKEVAKLGRKDKHGVYNFLAGAPKAIEALDCAWKVAGIGGSVQKFAEEHSQGAFIVLTSGHAQAVINGAVFDKFRPNGRCRVKMAFEIIKKGEVQP